MFKVRREELDQRCLDQLRSIPEHIALEVITIASLNYSREQISRGDQTGFDLGFSTHCNLNSNFDQRYTSNLNFGFIRLFKNSVRQTFQP